MSEAKNRQPITQLGTWASLQAKPLIRSLSFLDESIRIVRHLASEDAGQLTDKENKSF